MKEVIKTDRAPEAIGPYSQAVKAGGFIFVSGQIPIDRSGRIVKDNIKEETKIVIENIIAILEEAGVTIDNIVKTTVYLRNINDFDEFNEVYSSYFQKNPPARATVEVSQLPKGVGIEMEVVAIDKDR